jgi:hypothetical protein
MIVALVLTVGCSVETPIAQGTPSKHKESGRASGDAAKARKQLADLDVTSAGNDAGYARDRFGQRWKDTDHNGCDTRNDILARDLDDIDKRGRCVVTGGHLDDPYTGRDITFAKPRAFEVQIDHIYPLHLAWQMGAADWTTDKREEFANDRGNLLAVWSRPNEQKGDSGPAEWQPRKSYQCTYAIKFIKVATEYNLDLTRPDHSALKDMLTTC